MRCLSSAGALVRAARRSQGLSQRRLALRAGTSQDAISRIERGVESPTVERLERLMHALGERVEIRTCPLAAPAGAVPATASERLREAASWNLVAGKLEQVGVAARRAAHPATRVPGA
ncbi:MAG: helix-turn-helix domain-containing protein [Solirubrobacteraceae bacterium]